MTELAGPVIVTNYGEQQLLAGTFDITKIKLGSGIWTPTMSDTALNTEEASIPASGVVLTEAAGYRLRLSGVDDNDPNVYVLQEFALTDDTDQALAIYSQPTAIATKTSGVDLLFSINWLIDNTAGPITVSGATTYSLPLASTASAGIIEIATVAEAVAGADTQRAVTAQGLQSKFNAIQTLPLFPKVGALIQRVGTVWTAPSNVGIASVTSGAFGLCQVTFSVPFANGTNYYPVSTLQQNEPYQLKHQRISGTRMDIRVTNTAGTDIIDSDNVFLSLMVFGTT